MKYGIPVRMTYKTLITLGMFCLFVGSTIAQSTLMLPQGNLSPQKLEFIKKKVETFRTKYNQPIPQKVGTILSTRSQKMTGFAGFTAGTCTDYVATKRPDLVLGHGKRRISGDAGDWLESAKASKLSTGKIPKVGSIAVYSAGNGASSYGHVAYVEKVGSNGRIVISDMNYHAPYVVTKRVVSASLAAGYIY